MNAQNRVEGSLRDQETNPVAYANVILLAEDSTSVIKGVVSEENGDFLLENIEDGKYVIKVSFIGFEDYLKALEVDGNTKLKNFQLNQA